MSRTFSTSTELAAYLADGLDLDRGAVMHALQYGGERGFMHLFTNWGRIPTPELAALSAAVWTNITGHEYPEAWAQQWAALAQEEELTP